MGTDIHGIVQIRWRNDAPYMVDGQIDRDRNYMVFGMLAGLRGRYDLLVDGVTVPLSPISEPRGLPEDLELVSSDLAEYEFAVLSLETFSQVYLGDHTFSWLTLREILDWPGWDLDIEMIDEISREEYKRIKRDGGPPTTDNGPSPPHDIVIDESEIGMIENYTHVRYRWPKPFIEEAIIFRKWIEYIEVKYTHFLNDDPDAVRIVFGFDN